MNIVNLDPKQLKPYKLNAKKHPQTQIEGLAESIRRFGFTQPVVVDQNNSVIIGHGRIEAAKILQLETIPVVVRSDLTDAEIKALRILDNKLNESEWDYDLLSLDIENIDFDFEPYNVEFFIVDSEDDEEPKGDRERKKKLITCPECSCEFLK